MKITSKQIKPNVYRFPHWSKVAPTYGKAIEKLFKQISDTRSFKNYRELGPEYLRETDRKKGMIAKVTTKGLVEIEVQLGQKYKGKSVDEARKSFAGNEFGLGVYEVGCILLANPDVLKRFKDLWIDCPGDEYNYGGKWTSVPYFDHDGVKLYLNAYWSGFANSNCGSASAFIPAAVSTLESRIFGSVKPLTLEIKIGKIETCHIKVNLQDCTTSTKELEDGVILRVPLTIEITEQKE